MKLIQIDNTLYIVEGENKYKVSEGRNRYSIYTLVYLLWKLPNEVFGSKEFDIQLKTIGIDISDIKHRIEIRVVACDKCHLNQGGLLSPDCCQKTHNEAFLLPEKEDNLVRGKSLDYWKTNAEENYITTPISVLKYITVLEENKTYSIEQIEKAIEDACPETIISPSKVYRFKTNIINNLTK